MSQVPTEPIQGPEQVAGARLEGEDGVWDRFAAATDQNDFAVSWLTLLCAQLQGARRALLLLGEVDRGPFKPAAVWPDPTHSVVHLSGPAERTLRERRGLVLRRTADKNSGVPAGVDLCYPVLLGDSLHGALVVEVSELPSQAIQAVVRQIHWGTGPLTAELYRRKQSSVDAGKERVFAILDLVSLAVEEQRFQAAATALVSELATYLDSDRVSLGLVEGRQARVRAISHSATFGRQMNLIRLTEAAMDEAIDQQTRIWLPSDSETKIVTAHQALAQQQGAPELCTIPIRVQGAWQAALTLEHPSGRRLTSLEADFCETLGELAAPMLLCKREHERWLIVKAWRSARKQLAALIGPEHIGRKLVAFAVLALVAFFTFATGTFRVTADAALEGGELRALVAPFQGYIESGDARAGETVSAGQVLATLDDRDLKLEQTRIVTERAQFRRERREAAAEHDRAQVWVLTARIAQAEAELSLVEARLARTRITAPFDGILVSGDLTQSLGAPVRQGDLLFELAPVGDYRVAFAVKERDIDDVALGQTGVLVLAALPEQSLAFAVSLITPVATVVEGNNSFRVEARLDEILPALRPGMEGVGKIAVGERRLIWIWTRGFIQWLRLKLWAWWP